MIKGAHALPVLLVAALAGGIALHRGSNHHRSAPPGSPDDPEEVIRNFVAAETGWTVPADATVIRHPDRDLAPVIGSRLDERFGPNGLAHRTRACDLLQLLPPGLNLRGLLVAMESAGARAWFDDQTGAIHLIDSFDPLRPDDRSTLVRLSTRQSLHHLAPPPPSHPADDAWITRTAVHGGIASGVEARFIAATDGDNRLPSPEETEREAILLSLPVFLHNLAQIGGMQGRDFAEACRGDGATPWQALLADPPTNSLALFTNDRPTPRRPDLPATPGTPVFEESLGAYTTQLLLERLSDYLVAEGVAPAWRGDRYRLFTTGTGDHLVWVSQWATPAAATDAAAIIQNTLSPVPADPAFGTERRHTRILIRGASLLFLNCADPDTLHSLTDTPPQTTP